MLRPACLTAFPLASRSKPSSGVTPQRPDLPYPAFFSPQTRVVSPGMERLLCYRVCEQQKEKGAEKSEQRYLK